MTADDQGVNWYEILQVAESAEPEVIEAAYRRLSRKYHPDVNPLADAAERQRRLNEAFAVLGDPTRRRDYDRSRHACTPSPKGPPATPPWYEDEHRQRRFSLRPLTGSRLIYSLLVVPIGLQLLAGVLLVGFAALGWLPADVIEPSQIALFSSYYGMASLLFAVRAVIAPRSRSSFSKGAALAAILGIVAAVPIAERIPSILSGSAVDERTTPNQVVGPLETVRATPAVATSGAIPTPTASAVPPRFEIATSRPLTLGARSYPTPNEFCQTARTVDLWAAEITQDQFRWAETAIRQSNPPVNPGPTVHWRCWETKLLACVTGATGAPCGTVDATGVPNSDMTRFCVENPNNSFIPMAQVGRMNAWDWTCRGNEAVRTRRLIPVDQIDGLGYLLGVWYSVN